MRENHTPGCGGFTETETAASWGVILQFSFVAVFRVKNDAGIDKTISVGYKGEFVI